MILMVHNGEKRSEAPAQSHGILSPVARVASLLRQGIHAGRHVVGERLANERQLADQFSVSRGTIRQALQILETERLISRQQGRGTFVVDPAYAPVAGTDIPLIGALVYEKEFYFGAILQASASQSIDRGYMLATGSNATQEEERQHVEAFLNSGIRGVILAPTQNYSHDAYKQFVEHKVPVVLLDTVLPDQDEDFVSLDNRKGTYIATMYLVELGHVHIGYVGNNIEHDLPCRPERLGGFMDACHDARIIVPESWRIAVNEDTCIPRVREMLLQAQRPTAIIAYSDICAVRVIGVARELGLKVPGDLSVVGFDNTAVARNYDTPISSVHPEFREVGTLAANILLDKIDKPRPRPTFKALVTPRLVVRESTGPPS
jgi:DNA-binding LacI/PurR family transcriptional regulator